MKYIINVPEDRVHNGVLCAMGTMEDGVNHYLPTGIKATPYAIPYDESSDEKAWKFAQKILAPPNTRDALTVEDLMDCYGTDDAYDVVCEQTYAEARERYEVWKKRKDEIKIGDLVTDDSNAVRAVVLGESVSGRAWGILDENGCMRMINKSHVSKVGRHFPEVEQMLKKMRELE